MTPEVPELGPPRPAFVLCRSVVETPFLEILVLIEEVPLFDILGFMSLLRFSNSKSLLRSMNTV
jgi:hypothetical protein